VRVAAIALIIRPSGPRFRRQAGPEAGPASPAGWELYWVRRSPKLAFLGGFWAFPGGGAESGDATLRHTCAREVVEETGLELAANRFVSAGRTVTPAWSAIRFDATYYIAEVDDTAAPDVARASSPGELVEGEWIQPAEALRLWDRGERLTSPVAVHALRAVAAGGTIADIAGRLAESLTDPALELRLFDLVPGFAMAALRSPTIPPATHTNCFVVGSDDVVVVDPGSPYPEEQQALDESLAGRRLREIWVTHHHVDHVAGVEHLRALHRVPVAAHRGTAELLHGVLRFDRLLEDSEVVSLGSRRLRAVFTPGHTLGHLAFLEETTRWVLAGDHVAGVGTVVIDPDEGDMAEYLGSIGKLEALAPRLLLPAHGPLVTEPAVRLAEYRRHRLWREERVLEELSETPRTAAELVPAVYRDVPAAMHGFAERSLLAHLIKLVRDGRAVERAGRYATVISLER
jgi:ribonuclease/clavin/mitogillin